MSLWLRYKDGIIKLDEIESLGFAVQCRPHGTGRWRVVTTWTAVPKTGGEVVYDLAETTTVLASQGYPESSLYSEHVFQTFEKLLTGLWDASSAKQRVHNTKDDINTAYMATLIQSRS